MVNNIDFKAFPTTRYQGSKRKILPWIFDIVKDIDFNSVLDACGGTASVSYLFKRMGKSVTYNDKLKFNYLIGKALIENQHVTFLQHDIDNLMFCLNKKDLPSFIHDNFEGVYYLPDENKWLDSVISGIIDMNHYSGNILDYKKSLAFYALFQSAIIKRPGYYALIDPSYTLQIDPPKLSALFLHFSYPRMP